MEMGRAQSTYIYTYFVGQSIGQDGRGQLDAIQAGIRYVSFTCYLSSEPVGTRVIKIINK